MSIRINFTTEEQESIISRYKNGESGQIIADTYGCEKTTIYRKLQKWGIDTRHDTKIRFSDIERDEIIDRYVNGKQTAERIAKYFPCGGATIIRSLQAWNIEIRPRIPRRSSTGNKIYFTPQQKQQVIDRYVEGEWARSIAIDFKCSATTISKNLKEWGIEVRKLRPRINLSEQEVKRILQLYEEQKSLNELEILLGLQRRVIIRTLRENGALIRRKGKPQKYFIINGKKLCRTCNQEKLCTEFTLHSNTSDGLQSSCRECSNKKSRNTNLQIKFGITQDVYDQMWLGQEGVCAVCGQPETRTKFGKPTMLAVDHNHETDVIRELVCFRCNVVIGRIEENPDLCDRIKAYLLKHKKGN